LSCCCQHLFLKPSKLVEKFSLLIVDRFIFLCELLHCLLHGASINLPLLRCGQRSLKCLSLILRQGQLLRHLALVVFGNGEGLLHRIFLSHCCQHLLFEHSKPLEELRLLIADQLKLISELLDCVLHCDIVCLPFLGCGERGF